jgi:hypothetical protein
VQLIPLAAGDDDACADYVQLAWAILRDDRGQYTESCEAHPTPDQTYRVYVQQQRSVQLASVASG